ncbi:hypothetical protein [Thalassospira lucentensis]|uniref:hypothetical protein n=1 Tax=Thalassospira lucentensis TaxID=168935 RepID=UPI00142DE52C|nr:hypothetical protein [Thalassospira lucentensis]
MAKPKASRQEKSILYQPKTPSSPKNDPEIPPIDFTSQVADFEIELLEQALCANADKHDKAAKALDLNDHPFRLLLEKHGLSAHL